MRMLIRRLAPLGLAAMLVVLAGCPLQPSLSVTPLALDFSAGEDLRTFRIRNQGAGTLEWQAQSNASWLLLAESTRTKQSASVSGTTTTEIDVVEVTVDRSQLALGQSNGLITITSNDGTETIPVSVTQTAPAQLEVSSTEVNLGISGDQATFTITNTGNEDLEWSLSETAPWLTVSPTQGTAEQGESDEVTVRVERAELPGGESTANIAITSNGGNANVLVRVTVPPFAVSPESVEFGFLTEEDAQVLALTNNQTRSAAISITTTTSDGAAWLTVDQPNVNVPQLDSVEITVQVDPAGLPPGEYNGQVRFNDAVAGFSQTVPVSMAISAFVVSETLLEFGEISTTTTRTFSVSNIGTGSIAYSISVPAADAEWLSVNPASGNVTGDDIIEVRIDPAAVAPGSYESTLTITFEGGETTVAVRFSRPRPATLRVEPNTIDFSTTRIQELIGIWNDGIGTINWEVDTTAFPAWLVLTPVDGSGIASGTVSGAETDTITVRVRRELAPPGEFDLEHQFLVEASGDSTTPVQVTIRATVPLIPAIEVIGDGADENLVQFVNFDVDEIEKTFVIRNTGTGDLNWSIDLEGAPAFISSVSPQQGVLGPGAQQTVTITVDRSTLDFLGAQFTLQITSNDPVRTAVPLLVEVQVAKKIVIGARPLSIPFGVNVTSATLEVANFGDPETVLNFKVTPTKDWLAVFPETGRSIGTQAPIKDFQPVSVTVDRSKLEGSGVSGKLIITAFEVQDGVPVPIEDVAPVEVIVSAEAAELTIETPKPRAHIPSLIRSVLLMRNLRFQALPIPATRLEEVGGQFRIFEDNQAVESAESNQFLTSSERLRTNLLIMLDYSGSMQAAARRLEEDGQIANPGGGPLEDPLQFVYEQCLPSLILELPDNYRIALGVFNDRAANLEDKVRIIRETPDDPAFVKDKARIMGRLFSINVEDNGATELLPAITRGAEILLEEDETFLFPFDDADVRGIICVTDGRLTTPPGNVNETRDFLIDAFARVFAVGWGQNVAADPLIRLSGPTGGHFYSTRTEPTGTVDAFGTPIRKPLLSELIDWCETNPADPCDQSIAKDLQSQVVLSYTTLREETSVNLEGRITFNDPNDGPVDPRDPDSACLPDQGNITGDFARGNLNYSEIVGDIRLGQISLESSLIEGGEATTLVRLEYAPRNVRRFSFFIQNSGPGAADMEVSRVPLIEGGAIADWTQTQVGDVFTFETPDGAPLAYGDFGSLIEIRFTNITAPFVLLFDVLEPILTGDPNSKYFTHADSIPVDTTYARFGPNLDSFFEPAFPRPMILSSVAPSDSDPLTFDFGTDTDVATLGVANIGGSHVETGVGLGWTISENLGNGLVTPSDFTGFVTSTLTPDTFTLIVDRSLNPGEYSNSLEFTYDFGSIDIEVPAQPIFITYEVLPPNLGVSPLLLDFGATTTELPLTVSNIGQSTMEWSLNSDLFPLWLSSRRNFDFVGPEVDETFNVLVNRQDVPPGAYEFTIVVSSVTTGQSFDVLVRMTVL